MARHAILANREPRSPHAVIVGTDSFASSPSTHLEILSAYDPYSVLLSNQTSSTIPTMTAMGKYLRMSACNQEA